MLIWPSFPLTAWLNEPALVHVLGRRYERIFEAPVVEKIWTERHGDLAPIVRLQRCFGSEIINDRGVVVVIVKPQRAARTCLIRKDHAHVPT